MKAGRITADYEMENLTDDPEICHPGYYHPLCVMSVVVDSSHGYHKIDLAIHITPGTSKKEISVQVGPTQTTLDIYFTWPRVMTDVNVLHKYWMEND